MVKVGVVGSMGIERGVVCGYMGVRLLVES